MLLIVCTCYGANKIRVPFELPHATDVHRTPSTNAHKLTTVTIIPLNEFLETNILYITTTPIELYHHAT